MSNPPLLLAGPFGWDAFEGIGISLLTNADINVEKTTEVLSVYSCHKPAIPKILNCLKHSGFYQCILQRQWFRNQYGNCIRDFADIGIELRVDYEIYRGEKRDFTPPSNRSWF